MFRTNEPQGKWYRMDNSADIYPMSSTMTTMSIFRLSAEMEDYVDGDNLQAALADILPRFPTFAVQLRKGFFRYYFDANELEPRVFPDNGILFQKIDSLKNNRYLFRVQYYKKRISVDFFHGLCDGTGAMEFLKALVYRYLDECGETLPPKGSVKVAGEPVKESETEDSISRYYTQYKLTGGVVGKMAGKNCFGIRGKRFKTLGYGLIHGYVSAEALHDVAKKMDCTVTALIAGAALLAIKKAYYKDNESGRDIVAMIPINLRKIFPSETLRNFTTLTKCAVCPAYTADRLSEYVAICKRALSEGLSDKKELAEKLSLSAFYSTNPLMKILPVGLKTFFTKFGKAVSTQTKQTIIISNLGVVKLPDGMEEFVNRFTFSINISKKVPVNMGIVTYNGKTAISFTRMLVSTELEKQFFAILSELGLEIEISSNLRELGAKGV